MRDHEDEKADRADKANKANKNTVRTALAQLGPFFAVDMHDAGSLARVENAEDAEDAENTDGGTGPPDGGTWRSMAELADGSGALAARVAAVRGVLAAGGGQPPDAVELRVAASVVHLGLVARVVAPYLALAALYGWAPPARLRLADLRWRPALGGPYPLSVPWDGAQRDGLEPPGRPDAAGSGRPGAAGAGLADPAAHFAAAVCDGAVRELVEACGPLRVSPRVLWGNVASAVNGAAGMVAAARPDVAERARALAGSALERVPLRGSAGHHPGGGFRRRSCCLIYRAAPDRSGALCGDCALSRVPTRPT